MRMKLDNRDKNLFDGDDMVFLCHPDDAKSIMTNGDDSLMVTFKGMSRGNAIGIPCQEFLDFVVWGENRRLFRNN